MAAARQVGAFEDINWSSYPVPSPRIGLECDAVLIVAPLVGDIHFFVAVGRIVDRGADDAACA